MLQDKFNLFFKTSNTYDGEMKKKYTTIKSIPVQVGREVL